MQGTDTDRQRQELEKQKGERMQHNESTRGVCVHLKGKGNEKQRTNVATQVYLSVSGLVKSSQPKSSQDKVECHVRLSTDIDPRTRHRANEFALSARKLRLKRTYSSRSREKALVFHRCQHQNQPPLNTALVAVVGVFVSFPDHEGGMNPG